jgi:hypothetical protein
VAIVLGQGAFDPRNKATTVAVLRHELEHASHDRLAITWLERWRADTRAAKQSFTGWLAKQRMAEADRSLVLERVEGKLVDTEALGHLEGFIAGFPIEAPDVSEGAHPAYDELEVAADGWLDADDPVRAEFSARLRLLQGRLKGERLTSFAAVLGRLKAHDKRLAALVDPLLGH